MKLIKSLKMFKSNQDGAVIVFVAMFMTIIIGISALVLDLGLAFNKQTELQKDLDSIALAAVKQLPATSTDDDRWHKAVEVAVKYAELNGLTGFSTSDIEPVSNSDNTKIIGMTVKREVDVSYNFAKVLGYQSGKVGADSTAEIRTVDGGMTGLLPFVIDYQSMQNIQNGGVSSITIKYDALEEITDLEFGIGHGWFGPVDIDKVGNDSGSVYKDKIAYGSTVPLDIGDNLNLVSGNMIGPTAAGFNIRFAGHFDCEYDLATKLTSCGESDCPRICTVPVAIVHTTDNGKKVAYLEVVSFATVFIEIEKSYLDKDGKISLSGNEADIKVKFIEETIVPTATVGDINDEANFGVYSPRLTN